MDVDEARAFVRTDPRATFLTYRADGSPQLSLVLAAVGEDGTILVSTRETAMKALNLRRDPRCSLLAFTENFYGPQVQIDGRAVVVPLPEAMDGLIDYYRRLSGEHPDWDDYRSAMARERRVLVRITPERAGPNRSG